jgi:hypothetical protein
MIQKMKKAALAGVVTAAAVGSALAFAPAPAQAAAYNGACGGGYRAIDSFALPGMGTVWLTYNDSTGKNCVVTIANTPGARRFMAARLSLGGAPTWTHQEEGQFTTYAGPVYMAAANRCIDWGGAIQNVSDAEFNDHCN